MAHLILVRHAQSESNERNQFTGWADPGLSVTGSLQSRIAAEILRKHVSRVDLAFSSVLARATQTLEIILDELHAQRIPVVRSWRLNERHYGELEGMDKTEATRLYGEEQVLKWRRSYTATPPLLSPSDPRYLRIIEDPRYSDHGVLPRGESLQAAVERVLPFLKQTLGSILETESTVLVVTHGNVIRGLCAAFEGLRGDGLLGLTIPNAVPMLCEIGPSMVGWKSAFLGAPAAMASVLGAAG